MAIFTGKGIKSSTSVLVNTSVSGVISNYWIKIAACTDALGSFGTHSAAFRVVYQGAGNAAYDDDDIEFIARVRWQRLGTSSGVASVSGVHVEMLNDRTGNSTWDESRVALLHRGVNEAELWLKAPALADDGFVWITHLGGASLGDGPGAQTQDNISEAWHPVDGQSWQAAVPHTGDSDWAKIDGTKNKKRFETVEATTFIGALDGNSSTTTSVNVTENNNENSNLYLTFVDGQTGAQGIETDIGLRYNPNLNTLIAGTVDVGVVTGASSITSTTFVGELDGNAGTATQLETARNIGGVSFDGTGNIDLPGVNTGGNQNTSGNAATATALAASVNIGGVSFDGSSSIDLPGVNTSGNQNTSGIASNATNVYVEDDNTSNVTRYLTFVDSSTQGYKRLNEDSGLTYVPGSNTLTATRIAGSLQTSSQPNITSVGTLSSLSVTGDLTIDTSTLKVDSSNNRVGVGVTDPDQKLEVAGAIHLSGEISTPAQPADGDGGIIYVKSNGKLFFRSNEVEETNLGTITTGDISQVTGNTSPLTIANSRVALGITPTTTGNASGYFNIYNTGLNPLDNTGEPEKYHMLIQCATTNNSSAGIAFGSSAGNVGSAIIYKDVDSFAKGQLHFYTKQSTGSGDDPVQAMVIDEDGKIVVTGTTYSGAAADLGRLVVHQTSDAANEGLTVLNTSTNRSIRIWVDSDNRSRIRSGGGGDQPLVLNSGGGGVRIGTTAVGNASLYVSRNATMGGFASPAINNAGVRIDDSAGSSMYIDGNSILMNEDSYIGTIGSKKLDLTTNGNSRIHIAAGGNVGIGTTAPSDKLHVNGDIKFNSSISTQSNESAYFQVNGSTWFSLNYDANGDHATGSSQSNCVLFQKGVKISRGSGSWFFDNTHALQVRNDGDSTARKGIAIYAGQDNGTGTLISFRDGNGTAIGQITFSGGTVSYGQFTGIHTAKIKDIDSLSPYKTEIDADPEDPSLSREILTAFKPGTLVKMLETYRSGDMADITYLVEMSDKALDKSVMGVYKNGNIDPERLEEHDIASLGDGVILVCPEGGDIEIGDYLASSSKAGHAMKQSDDLLHNYTVAKSTQNVKWEKVDGDSLAITCTLHSA